MSDTPFIKFYPSDFLAGTSGLSPAERGCYVTLLCLIYEADGPIPRDDARLARRCGAPKATFLRILRCLIDEGKITDVEGMISNKRAEIAIVDRQNRSQKATIAANAKWKPQSEKTQQKQGSHDANASPKQCLDTCQPEPEPDITTSVVIGPFKKSPSKRRRSPERELPEGWVPDIDKARRVMDEYSLTREEMNLCYKAMEAHAHANQRKQRDWDAAYRNWVIKDVQFGNVGPKSKRRSSGGQASIWD